MPILSYSFYISAPLPTVMAFHRDPAAFRRLTPPPLIVQLHHFDPPEEGAEARFTLWFGPFPITWHAIYQEVDLGYGFTDVQRRGPLQAWRHTHRFTAVNSNLTLVEDTIAYTHRTGWRGLLSRLIFAPVVMRLLFSYRKWVTRYLIARRTR